MSEESESNLRVGQYGYSLDIILGGKHGFCYFDGERHKVKAGGDIRKWAEVIVITKVPEPTVIETWSVFPLSYALDSGGFQTVGESTPLPVALRSLSGIVVEEPLVATAEGVTELAVAPGQGKKIVVLFFSMSNKHTTLADVGLTFDKNATVAASTKVRHRVALAASGGNAVSNLVGVPFQGGTNEALQAFLFAAYSTGVIFNVTYKVEDA